MADNHKRSRRDVLKYGGVSIAGASIAGCLGRDGDGEYPNQPIRIVVPFSEGGSTDTYARQLQPALSDELGVEIQIENVPGSASLRGAQEAFTSDPDGYTYLMMNPPSTPLSTIINETDWDITEMKGVATYEKTAILAVANPEHEIEDFEDLVSRYSGGELSQWAGQTVGSYYHVASLYMRQAYDLDFDDYIGYEGNGPATQSIVSNENPAGISSSGATQGFTEDDRLEVVVQLGSAGTPAYPDTPTLTDLGYDDMDFLGNLTRTFAAPPETSDENIDTFSSAIESTLEDDEVQSWGEETGANFVYEGPDSTDQLISDVVNTVDEELDVEAIREQIN
ncbi:ABC transporter substrate-binding protein [Natrinema sp. CBA1119]|uniref:Bug family tripartite tricarboxylate transporter substrate binding protein n=1 Tax=Natrinema sp. CBA1119 TaxID=1608465 RepID=UPI000BFA3D32|nr:tripartite tricarboxylate transporter substrate-binding protein [Natrinema sp. CBA1119]PGF13912.1 ABC transporter substrate-binding protein [Natrinema sp. CBA1119]